MSTQKEPPQSRRPQERAFPLYDPRGAQGRFVIGTALGLLAFFVVPARFDLPLHAIASWDVGTGVILALSWLIIARADARETRRRAAAEDPGRRVLWAVALVSSAMGMFAAALVLQRAKCLEPGARTFWVTLALLGVLLAWTLVHTAYTLRYARLYYSPEDTGEADGLDFPGDEPPSDMDFAYFAFTIGMCFQTSDVEVTSRRIRRATLGHALLSFAFNTTILALALNLVAGLLG